MTLNEQGAASLRAILDALPFGMNNDLLLFSIFGSQVKGTERHDSDLDVLLVTRKSVCITTIHDTITKTPGGVEKCTILPHIPETISTMANVYGSVEYGVLREDGAKTLYRSADFDIALHQEIDYEYCTMRWMERAHAYIFPEEDHSESWPASTCFWMYMGVESLLRAGLLSIRVRFPFTRDVRVLYEMIPPERRPPVDIGAVAAIRERYEENNDEKCWSPADVRVAKEMAGDAYDFTRVMTRPIKAV